MGEMASLWGYTEHHDMDQLRQKLLFTTLELEKLKAEAKEEMRKNKEYVKQLIHLLNFAIQERDEARNQLQKLLNKTTMSAGKANTSITESNSLSAETYNYQSHGSSPVESLFDAAVSSPEFSNINLVVSSEVVPKIDKGSLVINKLVRGRALPQKGKFLQAVLEAGPLLQTLLVAGPLPRWRNPPQLQPFQISPVSIKGCDADVLAHTNMGHLVSTTLNSQPYPQMACGSSQLVSAHTSNFANVASGTTCLNNASLISSAVTNNIDYVHLVKRQRFS